MARASVGLTLVCADTVKPNKHSNVIAKTFSLRTIFILSPLAHAPNWWMWVQSRDFVPVPAQLALSELTGTTLRQQDLGQLSLRVVPVPNKCCDVKSQGCKISRKK